MKARNIARLRAIAGLILGQCAVTGLYAGTAATNAGPAAADSPKSVFVMPTIAQEGRDPFFPRSDRMLGTAPITNSTPSAPVSVVLNGLGGTEEKRLAMINGKTFAEGEGQEISSPSGRVRVVCIEIKRESVIVEVGGERRELRFRQTR